MWLYQCDALLGRWPPALSGIIIILARPRHRLRACSMCSPHKSRITLWVSTYVSRTALLWSCRDLLLVVNVALARGKKVVSHGRKQKTPFIALQFFRSRSPLQTMSKERGKKTKIKDALIPPPMPCHLLCPSILALIVLSALLYHFTETLWRWNSLDLPRAWARVAGTCGATMLAWRPSQECGEVEVRGIRPALTYFSLLEWK